MLVQKFHRALRLGKRLTPIGSANPLFSRQGHWNGGSTLHCVAMALALLDQIGDPVSLPYHDEGNERIVWDHAWPHYLHGLTPSELASFVAELNLGLRTVENGGQAPGLMRFCERELRAGWPVVIGWQQRLPVQAHAALVIGIEGHQHSRTFEPHALLLLYHSTGAARAVTPEGALSIRTIAPRREET